MIFDATGEVSEGFHVLGSVAVPVYLLDGPTPVLFDGGVTCLGGLYEEAIRGVLGNRSPAYLFLTHVHFDHCGAVSRLRRAFPDMKVAGSARAGEILGRPNAVRLIRELNRSAADAVHGIDPALLVDDAFEPFGIDRVVEPGETLDLGNGTSLRVLHTPGHTWDFMSYYVPEKRYLVASEAAGVMHTNGYVVCECLIGFDVYMTSLRRLAALPADVLCQAHQFVFTGSDVEDFLRLSTRTAMEFRALVEDLWEENGGDLQATVERVKSLEYDFFDLPRQPEAAYLLNLEARIRSVVKEL